MATNTVMKANNFFGFGATKKSCSKQQVHFVNERPDFFPNSIKKVKKTLTYLNSCWFIPRSISLASFCYWCFSFYENQKKDIQNKKGQRHLYNHAYPYVG